MSKLLRRTPSPSLVISIVALVLAASGTAVAASKLVSGNSLIKEHSLSGNRLENHTLSATQINVSKLGKVPHAALADQATNATTAASATNATTATSAGSAPIAKVTYVTSTGNLGAVNVIVPVTASCPAGTYVIGGGGSVSDEADSYVNDSYPAARAGWTVDYVGDGATGTVTTTAICAPAASTAP